MEFPVRCFSCGAIIGHKYEEYKKLAKELGPKQALDKLGIKRYCCRRMFISHVEIADEVYKYENI